MSAPSDGPNAADSSSPAADSGAESLVHGLVAATNEHLNELLDFGTHLESLGGLLTGELEHLIGDHAVRVLTLIQGKKS